MAGESENTVVLDSPGDHTNTGGSNVVDADAASEAQQDEVLSRILSDNDDETKISGDRVRDEHGRFSKPDATKPEAKSQQTPEPTVPEGVKPDDYRKALKALQFDKVPQKTLDTLSPSEIVEWGLERAKNHADVSRLKTDLANAKKSTPVKPDAEAKAEPAAELDWSKLVDPVAKTFQDYLGDSEFKVQEPLTAFGKQIAEAVKKEFEAKHAAQQQVLDSIQSQFRSQQQEAARAKLTEKFNLDEADRWQKVVEFREQDKNEYASEYEAIQAACRHEFADEIIASYESKLKEQHKLRDKGQSTTSHTKTPPKARTQDDVETDIIMAIMDGDKEKAARLGRSAHPSNTELAMSE